MSDPVQPFVSVIIPIYGDAGVLDTCLDCLARQTYPRARFEIIVVDNGCPEIARSLARHPTVVLVRESRPGSYAARNAGLLVARGEIIAFTDADCLPFPDWIERGVERLGRSDATGIVAGPIELVSPRPDNVSPTAYLYSALLSLNPDGFKNCGGYGATANLMVRRAIIDTVGPFNPKFLSGGDMEWGRRAKSKGFLTVGTPDVSVGHHARPTVRAILARELRLAGGNQTSRQHHHPPGLVRNLFHIVDVELKAHAPWHLSRVRSRQIEAAPVLRAQVGALIVLVQALRAAERMRVLFGGTPRRA